MSLVCTLFRCSAAFSNILLKPSYCQFRMEAASSSQWACSSCTFLNTHSANKCQICHSGPPALSHWPCLSCTFLNNLTTSNCQMCGAMPAGTPSHPFILDDDEAKAEADSLVGTRFRPLQSHSENPSPTKCKRPSPETDEEGWVDMKKSTKVSASTSASASSITNTFLRDLHMDRISRITGGVSSVEEVQGCHEIANSSSIHGNNSERGKKKTIMMAETPEDERDEEFFKEVYGKEYTGPPKLNTEQSLENNKLNKRPRPSTNAGGESDDEQQERDPNAVPTDFTSREAKVWEAKSKAIERNWKRKKEEELICKICGESGHFTQGCPTTLGANRTKEFVEKIPVKDKRLKPRIIGSGGSVIQKIERDTGCRIRIEDDHTAENVSFVVRIAGPDRLCLIKGTDAVKKLVNEAEDGGKSPGLLQSSHRGLNDENPSSADPRQPFSSQRHRSRSGSPSRMGSRHRNSKEEKLISDNRFSQLEGGRKFEGSSSHIKSSPNFGAPYSNKSDRGSYQHHGQAVERGMREGEKWVADVRGKELEAGFRSEHHTFPKSLEELEQDFLKEALEIFGAKSAEEDDEKMRHRERLREIREAFQKNMVSFRARQMRQWEEFMHREAHAPQRHYQQQLDHGPRVYGRVGSAVYGGIGGGIGSRGSYEEDRPMEQQSGKFSASYDIYQGPRPDLYGGKAPYNADPYDNSQAFDNYR